MGSTSLASLEEELEGKRGRKSSFPGWIGDEGCFWVMNKSSFPCWIGDEGCFWVMNKSSFPCWIGDEGCFWVMNKSSFPCWIGDDSDSEELEGFCMMNKSRCH